MDRNRPGKRERRARLKKLEAAILSIIKNFDPRYPGYFIARDSLPAAAPRETFTGAGFYEDPDCLEIPLEFSPIVWPEGAFEPPPWRSLDSSGISEIQPKHKSKSSKYFIIRSRKAP